MGVARLTSLYDTEEKCILLIKNWRLQQGVKCRRCESVTHYWIASRLRFRCVNCRRETTLRSGTALEYSKLSYRDWVHTLLFLTDSKKPISAAHLQRLLRLKYYVPAWSMLHKLRYAMGQSMKAKGCLDWQIAERALVPVLAGKKDESGEKLRAMIESWKVFIATEGNKPRLQPDNVGAVARPSESKPHTHIHIRAELRDLMPPVFRLGLASAWMPGQVKSAGKDEIISGVADSGIDSLIARDHEGSLNWLGIIWLNARRNFHGIYHCISEKYIQNYLSEYAFLTNQRHLAIEKFDVLISLILGQTWFFPLVQASVYSGNPTTRTGP